MKFISYEDVAHQRMSVDTLKKVVFMFSLSCSHYCCSPKLDSVIFLRLSIKPTIDIENTTLF